MGIFLIFVVVSVIETNAIAATGFVMKNNQVTLSEIDIRLKDLRAQYLKVVFEDIAPHAAEAGFIAVSQPKYIQHDAVVAAR